MKAKEDGARLFLEVSNDRTGGNGDKPKYKNCCVSRIKKTPKVDQT